MGPEATILLMQRVFLAVPADDDAGHVPLIVHQNPQVPSRIAALIEGGGNDPGPILAQMARDLQAAGAQALAMPCNTAHHYAPVVTAAAPLPFLNMLDLTAAQLSASGAKKVGMLASPATRIAGVFDRWFEPHGLTPVWTAEEDKMLALIRAIKAGQGADKTGPSLARLAEGLVEKGADQLMVACTDISLITDYLPPQMPRTDSLDCLTAAIVDFAIRP
jgi:aspartate racemase